MKLDSLEKLYIHELKDLYSAEKQMLKAMPKLVDAITDDELKKAMSSHRKQTERQVTRLETILKGLDAKPGGHKCKGMEGLLEEASDALSSDVTDKHVRDAAIVAATQRIEHYEIAGYGTARTYAEKLGHYDAADLLQETLDEEAHTDQHLSRLATRRLNFQAMV